MITKQFTVYGRVQGVAFRFYTLQQAKKLGVRGYVKNLVEGSVLVVAEGSEAQLAELERWLHQGSPSAKVTNVITQSYQGQRQFNTFSIER
ncbi:acylphosphatase [Pasteurellaceae bacterium 22721_9_1]